MSEAARETRYDGTTRRGIHTGKVDVDGGESAFRSLVDDSPDAIVVHSDGRVMYANATAVRWLGAEYSDQIRGHSIAEFVHPESLEPALMRIGALRHAGDATHPSEAVLVRLDGTTLHVEAVTARTTWEGAVAYHVTIRDLTFLRTAQRSLREQAALVDRVGVAIIATTTMGLVTKWNRAAEAIYRRPASDALAQPLSVAVGAPLDPVAVLRGGGVAYATHRTLDGHPVVVQILATELDTGFALVCTDKTKDDGTERLLRNIIGSLDEGILVIDSRGVVLSANPSAGRILGLSARTLIGAGGRVLQAVPMYDAGRRRIPVRENPVAQTVTTGRAFQGFVFGIDRSDGRRIWLRASGRRLDGDHGDAPTTLVSFSDITAERSAQERLTYRATHDALTGLPNRAAVLNHISQALRARGDERLGAILFIDLDNLKAINDSLGHDSGDELLQCVANCLRNSLRDNDLAGRLGGDEFVALVAGSIAPSDLANLVTRLEDKLSEPMPLGAATVRTQASIGVTVVAPDDTRSAIEVLRDADSAMYEAKARRRQRLSRGTDWTPRRGTGWASPGGGRHSFRAADGGFDGGVTPTERP
jgi:diguanylate cyclase (GGDEF)-like protein/PAS domain S-box-containing protein